MQSPGNNRPDPLRAARSEHVTQAHGATQAHTSANTAENARAENAGPGGNLPTTGQGIVAALIGIGIGLGLSWYIDHRPIDPKFFPKVQASLNQLAKPINLTSVNPFPRLERRPELCTNIV